jgi:hypothetical protein
MNYAGIDHHRQYSHLTVMDPGGQVLRSGRELLVTLGGGGGGLAGHTGGF